MKAAASFDYSEILKGIKSGNIDTLCIVTSELYEDDKECPEHTGRVELYFAGTTGDECRNAINKLADECQPEIYTMVELFASQIHVMPEDFEDSDEDFAEDEIMNYIAEHYEYSDNIGTDDWNHRTVRYKYESMKDGIIIYWSWETYIGYARKFKKIEYLTDYFNTFMCKPVDKVFHTQCSLLVSPAEMKELKSASELRDLIISNLNSMGKWRNNCDVDDFLKGIYEDNLFCHSYQLPYNDYYELENDK